MSARRWFGGALLLAALALTGWTGPARAQSIVARVGGNLAGRVGDTLNVPITVDLTGAPGVSLGSYRMTIRFNPTVLYSQPGSNGTFAMPSVNTDSASAGMLRMTAIQPSGAVGVVTLAVGHFVVLSNTGASAITISFDQMSGVIPDFTDLLPYLTVVNGTFCHAAGTWGDVDGDGQTNSRDALIALSKVVGIALDTVRIDTLSTDTAGVHTETVTLLRPGLADVDGDGQITSRDALIIMSYAVGLPVPGFRIGLAAAAGACASGVGMTLAITPDTLELQTGQSASVVVTGRDSTGNPVSLSGATWTSGNTAVANATSPGFSIEARDPGVAILTVQLGAGYRASMVVKVLAHRTQWYVDARRSQAVLQTGSQALPFAFIQDALDAMAYDGDTIHVAPGTYEEIVRSDVAVTILGDTATDGSRPVIDRRFYVGYDSTTAALTLASLAGPVTLQNLRIVGGGVWLGSRGAVVRNVRIEAPNTRDVFYARYGSYSTTSGMANDPPGNALIDNLEILGYVDRGIRIEDLDTVVIRNSTVTRDSTTGGSGCSGSLDFNQGGIAVIANMHTELTGNTVVKSPCSAIHVVQGAGSAALSRNHVSGARAGGIVVSADTVALDRNVVLGVLTGILARSDLRPLRSVTSFADTVGTVSGSAFRADTASVVFIDSLDVDSAYTGIHVTGGGSRLTLTHSHIRNPAGFVGGNGVWVCGAGASLFSRGNRITNAGWNAIRADDCGDYGYPDTLVSVGDALVTTQASGIWSGASYTRIDNVLIDSTVTQYSDGIFAQAGRVLLVNAPSITRVAYEGILSLQVDTVRVTGGTISRSGGDGIYVEGLNFVADSVTVVSSGVAALANIGAGIAALSTRHMEVRWSSVLQSVLTGIWAKSVDTVLVTDDSIGGNGTGPGNAPGIYLELVTDYARVWGNKIDNNASGIVTLNGSPLVLDSNRVAGSTTTGWYSSDYSAGGSATRNAFLNNGWGVVLDSNTNVSSSLTLALNTFSGNTGGAVVNNSLSGATIDADSNYWGASTGPACGSGVTNRTNCPSSTAGDTIVSNWVTFFPWLDSADVGVAAVSALMLAQGAVRDAPIRPSFAAPSLPDLEHLHRRVGPPDGGGAAAADRLGLPQAPATGPVAAARLHATQPHPRPPLMTYRKGAPPRPVIVHHPQ